MRPTRIALVGAAGAFGRKHLAALRDVPGAELSLLVDPSPAAQILADEHGVGQVVDTLEAALARDDVDAFILCTPSDLHAAQARDCLAAGKHVLTEIPLAERLADAEAVAAAQRASGLVAMVGHTRRFNPPHRWLHRRLAAGELVLQQLRVDTCFLRRDNRNALGEPRSWTDHLLWHHAAHSVDLFLHQAGSPVVSAHALAGPDHPKLGIAMDMGILLRADSGAIASISLSFNNDGPLGTSFRYICDRGTFVARYDELVDGHGRPVPLDGEDGVDGLVEQDREFVRAIRERREPEASVARVMPCYRLLDRLERDLA